jgi:hypothetical protein
MTECPQEAGCRPPCLHEAAPEAEKIVSVVPVVASVGFETLAKVVSLRCAIGTDARVADMVGGAISGHEAIDQRAHVATIATAHENEAVRLASLPQCSEPLNNDPDGFIPTDPLPISLTPFADSFHRSLDPIRVVEDLEADVAFGTESP